MNTEQGRAEFETIKPSLRRYINDEQDAFEIFKAGYRAALQSQHNEEAKNLRHALWVANGAIGILQKKLDALQSQDREDVERLDWLEARAHDSSYATQIRLLRDPAINSGMNRIEVRTGVGSGIWERPTEGHSLREAIDRARPIEGNGE